MIVQKKISNQPTKKTCKTNDRNPLILQNKAKPDYEACVEIATEGSLKNLVQPGMLVLCTPIIVGFCLGTDTLAAVILGCCASGIHLGISSANSGGAWDNAKKYIEAGKLEGVQKGSDTHKAAIVGDTVGDPLKDTSGPSLNVLMKLTAVTSLVLASAMPHSKGGWFMGNLV